MLILISLLLVFNQYPVLFIFLTCILVDGTFKRLKILIKSLYFSVKLPSNIFKSNKLKEISVISPLLIWI